PLVILPGGAKGGTMTKKQPPLDRFGGFVMAYLRDKAIDFFDRLAKGKRKSQCVSTAAVRSEGAQQIAARSRAPPRYCRHRHLHPQLPSRPARAGRFRRRHPGDRAGKENVAKMSDGLHGEIFTDCGWMAKFSAFGEPPEEA